jgi:hypothetical protein
LFRPEHEQQRVLELVRLGADLQVAERAVGMPEGELARLLERGRPRRYRCGHYRRWRPGLSDFCRELLMAMGEAEAKLQAAARAANPASYARFVQGREAAAQQQAAAQEQPAEPEELSAEEAFNRWREAQDRELMAEVEATVRRTKAQLGL